MHSNVFSDLANLTDVNLGHNKLIRIRSDVFKFTPNLRGLLQDHNYLTFLPADLFRNLAQIQYLKLSNNMISSPAGNIFGDILTPLVSHSLSSQKYVADDYSKKSEIEPDSFQLPSTLKRLSLNHNKLSILRAYVFSNLVKLSNLDLSHNFLYSSLEEVFTGLTRLNILDLSDNLLTEFPQIALSRLQFLLLANNKVSSIYQKLFDEINIFQLDISHCKISIIPSNIFSNQTRMELLNLAFNEITHIMTNSFPSRVNFLRLNNNRLITLPHDIFDHIQTMSVLSLHNNRLVALPDFSSFLHIRYLRL